MTRARNSFAKRQRETGKKQKAEDKRARRVKRKEDAKSSPEFGEGEGEGEGEGDDGDRATCAQ